MIILTVIFLAIVFGIYAIIFLLVKKNIEKDIKNYKTKAIFKNGVIDNSLIEKLESNEKSIATLGAIGWPLYYLFYIGADFGYCIYEILIGENYENRIATWLI